ncbi:hypothetical protein NQ318_008646 [Aromia moschata]|uniref:Maturase K n=1 Tax=Aromia moschata TaxID=1265417 RepID=A0AAV8YYG5_9CUCU|nr:hypothetical protein NQ318_008646 [Aromia moschata]
MNNHLWDSENPHAVKKDIFSMIRQFLCGHFPHRCIGRGSEFVWPPRSPDLNRLDFSGWSNLKDIVYQEEVNSLQELRQRIQEVISFCSL